MLRTFFFEKFKNLLVYQLTTCPKYDIIRLLKFFFRVFLLCIGYVPTECIHRRYTKTYADPTIGTYINSMTCQISFCCLFFRFCAPATETYRGRQRTPRGHVRVHIDSTRKSRHARSGARVSQFRACVLCWVRMAIFFLLYHIGTARRCPRRAVPHLTHTTYRMPKPVHQDMLCPRTT